MVDVINGYSFLSQFKWVYLKELHVAIKPCEPALVVVDSTPPRSEPKPWQPQVIDDLENLMVMRLQKEGSVAQ